MILYTALETFNKDSDGWEKYKEWSQIKHLKEIVSLDCALCPFVLKELADTDWEHLKENVPFFGLFDDLDYLKSRIDKIQDCQILAVSYGAIENDIALFSSPSFEFKGFDLTEAKTGISALTNCGGFPEAFSNNELSDAGLIKEYKRAKEIKESLMANYPEEPHAQTEIWGIWKWNGNDYEIP